MSIDNKLRQIIQIKSDIKDAIISKGVEVDSSTPFNQYASKVSEIPSSHYNPWILKGYAESSYTEKFDMLYGASSSVLPYDAQTINVDNKPWEMFLNIVSGDTSSNTMDLVNGTEHYNGIGIYLYPNNQIGFSVSNSTNDGWAFDTPRLNLPVYYAFYVKVSFDGTSTYTLNCYDNTMNLILSNTQTASNHTQVLNLRFLSSFNRTRPAIKWMINTSSSYLKVDNEYIFGGDNHALQG